MSTQAPIAKRRGSPGHPAGVALVLAGIYGLTPIKRASQARCRELCALHGPLPFNLLRSAVTAGLRYGLSCAGCSAASPKAARGLASLTLAKPGGLNSAAERAPPSRRGGCGTDGCGSGRTQSDGPRHALDRSAGERPGGRARSRHSFAAGRRIGNYAD